MESGPLAMKLFTADWDLNPRDWDSNPAKTHGTWFQDLMKLRFLMPHRRLNSMRDKVIGKKWIYSDSERSTLHRQHVGHRRGWVWPENVALLVFIGWVISFANEWEDYSNYFLWTGWDFQNLGHSSLPGLLTVPLNCHYFSNKGPSSQSFVFSNSLVWMWELDYKESRVPKNWCFWTVVLKKDSWESLGLQGDPTSPS